jgi:hypothetical protein
MSIKNEILFKMLMRQAKTPTGYISYTTRRVKGIV